jgi:hypothetical protein
MGYNAPADRVGRQTPPAPGGDSLRRMYLIASVLFVAALVGFACPSEARVLSRAHRHHHTGAIRHAGHHRAPASPRHQGPARDASRDRSHHRATMPRLTHTASNHRGSAKHGQRHALSASSYDVHQHHAGTRIEVQSAIRVRSQEFQVISGRGPPPHPTRLSTSHPAQASSVSPAHSSHHQPLQAAGPSRDRSLFAPQGAPAQLATGPRARSIHTTETGQPIFVRPLADRLKGAAAGSFMPFVGGNHS